MSSVGHFGGLLGSGLFGNTCGATVLDDTILDTASASLLGMYNFKDSLATAANNPGLKDRSGGGATAIHRDVDDLLGNVERADSDAGNIGCCYNMLSGGRFGWGAPIPGGGGLPDSFTLMGFLLWGADSVVSPVAFVDWDGGNNNLHTAIHATSGGTITFDTYVNGTGLVVLAETTTTISDGWHMFTATYDNATDTPKLYLDNVDITPASVNTITGSSPVSHMTPGSATRSAQYYTSSVSCMGPCAFWDTALTAQQISDIWDASGLGP